MTVGFEMFGHGPHKVMGLHGWFGDETCWRRVTECLDPAEFSLASMAYRGYGASSQMAGEYSLKEIALDGLDLADELVWPQFSLLGHSMGGLAIQAVLARAPLRVRSLIAVTPVPASGVPFDEPTFEFFRSAAHSAQTRASIVDQSTGERLPKTWVNRIAEFPKESLRNGAFAHYLETWVRSDISAEIDGKRLPVQVIIGAHDAALNAELMRTTYLKWYPNAKLSTIEDAGHYPAEETPVVLAALVERFLRAVA